MLDPVLDSPVDERLGHPEAIIVKSHKNNQRTEASDIWVESERPGSV